MEKRTSRLMEPRTRCAVLVAACAVLSSASGSALANGRFPAAGQVAIDPADPAHVVVRATYGLISTRDHGGKWDWICEDAVGFSGNEDPALAITANGTLLAGLFNGLGVSPDGCAWSFAGGGLTDKYAIDVSTERADPSKAVALVSNGIGGGKYLTQLWESADSGKSWSQAGVDMPTDFLGLNVDVAPSDPAVVYVSGREGAPDYPGTLQRSFDRGQTWQAIHIAGADDTLPPYLSAIDPQDPAVLYVRLDGSEVDYLIVSADGGDTWTTAFESTGHLAAFALSPDGGSVLVGGEEDGIWRAPTSTFAFEKVSELGAKCLTWTEDKLYACADDFTDGFTVGVSADEGVTFDRLMHLSSVCGPLACNPQSSVGQICGAKWSVTQVSLGAESCDAGSGGNTSVGGAGGSGGGNEPAGTECGCSVPGNPSAPGLPAGILAGLFALALARRARARRLGFSHRGSVPSSADACPPIGPPPAAHQRQG